MSKKKLIINYYLPVVFWAGLIFFASSFSTAKTTDFFWGDFLIKKTAHLIEYGILAVLLYRAMRGTEVDKTKAFFLSIIISGLYGLTDEFHQSFTPGREPKIRDVVIDTIGATIGSVIYDRNS